MLSTLLEQLLDLIIPICAFISVSVIVISVVSAFYFYIRNLFTPTDRDIKIDLMSGMSLGLEFTMATEILKTMEKHDLENLLLLGGVILMRVVLALVIRFELKNHSDTRLSSGTGERKNRFRREKASWAGARDPAEEGDTCG